MDAARRFISRENAKRIRLRKEYALDVYEKIKSLGLEILPPTPKGGIYTPVMPFADKLIYVSGTGDVDASGKGSAGKLGRDFTLEEGQKIAAKCAMNIISNLHHTLGDLNRIKRFVKVLAFVASADDFYQQPQVVNGASQLILDVFGDEAGLPARSAIGVNVLPGNLPVEIEALLELK